VVGSIKREGTKLILRFENIFKDEIIGKIKEIKEYDIFIVGGYLRDFLLGKKSRDIDLVVYGDGKKFASIFGIPFKLKEEFDEWRVLYNDRIIDVLGIDCSIVEDLKRRDFTINSMGMNLKTLEFFDPMNGMKDLKDCIIRANSAENIKNDPVRILRGLRMMAELGFTVEERTMNYFKEYSMLLRNTAPERIHQELVLLFSAKKTSDTIIPEIFDIIFPGFLKMKEIKGSVSTDKDLLTHSILSLYHLEEIIENDNILKKYRKHIKRYLKDKIYLLKIATLIHDIKKPETIVIDEKVHFYGHDKEGAEWFKKIGRDLRFSNKEIDFIYTILRNHMWIHLLSTVELTERAIRRIIFRIGEDVIGLILFTIADELASGGDNIEKVMNVCNKILEYYWTKKKEIKPVILGRDIIKHFKISPGPEIGRLLRIAQEAYIEGVVRNKKEAIDFLKKNIKKEEL